MAITMLPSTRFKLMSLAGETTVDAYLLEEDDVLMALIEDGADYETLLEHCNENY